jgi:hypothetical protein
MGERGPKPKFVDKSCPNKDCRICIGAMKFKAEKIPNSKSQIPNNTEYQNPNAQNKHFRFTKTCFGF